MHRPTAHRLAAAAPLLAWLLLPASFPAAALAGGPLDPDAALASIALEDPELEVRLAAAEPEVADPVALAFDERGRLFVAEMGDYPLGPEGSAHIRLLEDLDGDGRFERSVVFAGGLRNANGLCPWRGGLFATCAPAILFLRDRDGDGRADSRRVVFSGFGTWNPQHLVNGLVWGIDGWIYCANGDSGGEVRAPSWPQAQRVPIRGYDIRFRPDEPVLETITGQCQFGLAFDDRGARFIANNRAHLRHVVIERRYLERNPRLRAATAVADVPDHGAACRVFQRSEPQRRFNDFDHVGYTTSACGITIYRGDALGPEYHGNAFSCEPVGNLVHRDILELRGATYTARRGRDGVEFLASTDPWFRPVYATTGPDGALYIADMYRETIEHPEWIPDDIERTLDLRRGADRGRIYRVARRGFRPQPLPDLEKAGAEELAEALSSQNAWRRLTALRRIVERGGRDAAPRLEEAARAAKPWTARAAALRALDLLGALEGERGAGILAAALSDPSPGAREEALRIAEPRLRGSPGPELVRAVLALSEDPDDRVRFQLALSIGELQDPAALGALAGIAGRHAEDAWYQTAILSSAGGRAGGLLERLLEPGRGFLSGNGFPGLERSRFLGRLAEVIGAGEDPAEIAVALGALAGAGGPSAAEREASLRWRLAFAAGLASGEAGRRALAGLLAPGGGSREPPGRRAAVESLLGEAAALALAADRSELERTEAVRLLGRFPFAFAGVLARLLDPRQPAGVQMASVRALGEMEGAEPARTIIESWRGLSPAVREEAFEALLARRERLGVFLDAVEKGAIRAAELPPARRRALLDDPEEPVRARAAALLAAGPGAGASESRAAVLRRLGPQVLGLPGDARRGREVFRRECLGCHRLAEEGHDAGPDLAGLADKSRESLLFHILDPSAVIDPKYVVYTALTRDRRVVTGILAAETGSSVTLRRAEGAEDVLLRQDLRSLAASGASLMPENLEEKLTPQDLADVIEFLLAAAPPEK